MNKTIKYLILLMLACPIFGQVDEIQLNSFKNAVEQYNYGNYSSVDLILKNIMPSEKEYYKEDIALLSMRVKYRLNDYNASEKIGKSILRNFPNSEYKTDVFVTFGDIFIAKGLYDAAFRTYLKAYEKNYDRNYRNNIVKRIFLSLQFGIHQNTPEELLSIEINNNLRQLLLLAKAHTEIQSGKAVKANSTLSLMNTNNILSEHQDYYLQLQDKVSSITIGKAVVGVVLPLTGKDAKAGQEFLAGLKHAEANNFLNNVDLSFVVHNNAGDAIKTAEIYQKIANSTNIVATIGPLSEANSIVAGSTAASSGILMIMPTATASRLSDVSDNIFMMNSTLKKRAEVAAEFIVETLNAENIAVLVPADQFGKILVDAFTEKLKSLGKTPKIIEWYVGLPTDLDRQFKSIRATAWELASETTSFVDSLGVVRDTVISAKKYYNKHGALNVTLTSIDAIYMPIHPGHLNYIGAQYPAYNLKAVVVGNDNWVNLDVLRKENIGPHFAGMIAISNYNDFQLDSLNRSLGEKHSKYFYQAIDCYNLLSQSVTNANLTNGSLLKILSNIEKYKGVFGTYDFSENHINSSLNIMKYNGYKFEKYVDPFQFDQY